MSASRKLMYFSPEPKRQGHASFTHVHEIINGLGQEGWSVDLYSPQYDGSRLPGVLHRLWGILATILRAILATRPDAYYMRWHPASFPVALWGRLRRIPMVIEVNGPVDDLFIAWPITRRMRTVFTWIMTVQLRWSSAVVAVTDGLQGMCRTIAGPEKTVATIPNGANTDLFSPNAAKIGNDNTRDLPGRFIVFFGTMAPWQGIRTVLAALDEDVWPKDVHAVFAGDGVERPAVEAVCARLGHAHYLGRVPYESLPAVVARAEGAFVCTENLEGRASTGLAPLKLFESLASGVPVIATEMPFQAEVVRGGACGYVVPPGDPAGLAACVAELAKDSQKRREMGENARRVAVEEHSWRARARDTHQLLLHVLEQQA
ncbi:MAG: glycosyltransferase family 4 protein [Alphaproteobacteria bacterium]|nr:glycosyltransferase family 4 protein [Alphaproteobacteria bacterium]